MAENPESQIKDSQPEEIQVVPLSTSKIAVNSDEQTQIIDLDTIDVSIKFIGATSISKKDFNTLSDPYFITKIDNKIKYTSV